MKSLMFAALACLMSSSAIAETVTVTAQLTRNGELISDYHAGVESGREQTFKDIELVSFKKSATQTGKKVTYKRDNLETGFKLVISPRVVSTGEVMLRVSMMHATLLNMGHFKSGSATLDQPDVMKYEIENTRMVKSGHTLTYPFGSNQSRDTGDYVLTITPTIAAHD